MKTQTAKQIINLAKSLSICKYELAENFNNQEKDFEVENYRFIEESEAIDILKEQYEGDPYILGCFNDYFIADCCNINLSAVKALQKAEAHEELGELILQDPDGFCNMIEEYARVDGYGHAFGSYDHTYEEVDIDGVDYIYFRTN